MVPDDRHLSRLQRDKTAEGYTTASQKIKVLEKKRQELMRKIKELGLKIYKAERAQAAISHKDPPVLRLPVEVTILIFQYLMTSDSGQLHRANQSIRDLPRDPHYSLSTLNSQRPKRVALKEVVLSHVCTDWRSIALGMPILWTSYRYLAYIFYPPAPSLHRLEVYLERSGNELLDLKFDFRIAQDDHYDCSSRLQMLAKIMAHVKRWRRVFIMVDKHTPFLDLLDNFKNVRAPNLEHFSLRTSSYSATSRRIENLQPVIFKGGAPNLSSVAVDFLTHLVLSPLSNITTLRIEQPKPHTQWDLISSEAFISILLIPSLTNLSLVGVIGPIYFEDSEDVISMHNLKHLRLADSWSMTVLLPYLKAPLLETLIIRNLPEEFYLADDNYSFPSLHTLVFEQRLEFKSPEFVSRSVMFISMLTRHATYIAFSHFSSLRHALLFRSYEAFWPNLQVVNFNIKGSTRVDDYLRFATSRTTIPKKPPCVLRFHNNLIHQWHVEAPYALDELERICVVEGMTTRAMSDALIANRPWPPVYDDEAACHDRLEIDADDHLNLLRDVYHS